jgi:hypothetical protein
MKNTYYYTYLMNFPFFLGHVYSTDRPFSDDVFIYKIGEYANFTEVNNFINENEGYTPTSIVPPPTSISTSASLPLEPKSTNNSSVIIASLSSILGTIVFGFIGFIIYKHYKKTRQNNNPVIPTP